MTHVTVSLLRPTEHEQSVPFLEFYAKSPLRTPVQFTTVDQVPHKLLVNAEPLERLVHQSPVNSARPVMSDLPSPLKSPTWTSTQVTLGFQVVHRALLNVEPVDKSNHH